MIEAQILENHKIMISKNAVSDSVKYETVRFTFPKFWDNYAKTAVFKNGGRAVSVVLDKSNPLCLSENECYIPHEVLHFPGFSVSVFGNEGETLATTANGFVAVIRSGYEKGVAPKDPTPDEYAQIIALMNEAKDIAQSVRDDADNGVFDGDSGEDGVPCITGNGAPTSAIKGEVGSLYIDTYTKNIYKCTGTKYGLLKAGSGYTTNWDEFGPARFKIPNVQVGDIVELRFDFSVNLDGVSDDVRTRVVTNDERILWPVFRQYNADGSVKAERIFELKNSTQGMINCAFTVGDSNEFYRIIIRSAVGLKECWELSNFFAIPSYGGENIGSTTVGSNTVYDAPINLDFSDGLNYWLNVGTADNPKVVVEGGLPIWEGIADQTYRPESENAQSGKAVAEVLTPLAKAVFGDDDIENMLFDSFKDNFIYNSVIGGSGNVNDAYPGKYRTPYIDISGGTIVVKLNSYTSGTVLDEGVTEDLYIAQFDENKTFISGSRERFELTSGDITSYNLVDFINNTPALGTIIPATNAKYAVLFNFNDGSTADLEIYVKGETSSDNSIGLVSKVKDLSKIISGSTSVLFDSTKDNFIYNSVIGGSGNVNDAYPGKYRTPYIDISGGTIVVKLNSYASGTVLDEGVTEDLYIAQFDENKTFISGSRKRFELTSGDITSYNLVDFINNTPALGTIIPATNAKYAVLFNFNDSSTADLEVYKDGEKGLIDKVKDLEQDKSNIDATKPFVGSENTPLISTVCGNSVLYPIDFSALVVTDMHGKFISLEDAELIRDTYVANVPILNMGDMINGRAKTDGSINSEVTRYMEKAVKYGVYHTMGQHEVGWSNTNVDNPSDKGYYKTNCMTHEDVFANFIEPMKSIWGLNDLTTNYYYKDFTDNKMRLISLYQYNIPLYDDPNDSSKYKYLRSSVWLGQGQLDWLISTLNSVPDGYRVIIMMHQCESQIKDAGDNSNFFYTTVGGSNHILSGTPVMDIVQAYIDKTTINKTYNPKEPSKYTESDFTVTVSGDFTNAEGKFANYITGDSHQDSIGYAGDTTQRALGITSSNQSYDCVVTPTAQSEHRRIITLLGYCYSKNFVKVGRIGQQYSLTGQHRVIEKVTI